MRTGKKNKLLRGWLLFAMLILLAAALPLTAHAKSTKKKNKWVKKNGYYYYYNSKGKKSKGLTKIGSKKYYFDSKGRQRTGWRKIGSDIYFFRNKSKKSGFMKKSTRVNGIWLGKKGRAQLTSERARRKAALMVNYQNWVDQLTTPKMTQEQKLMRCFDYLRSSFTYRVVFEELSGYGTEWDIGGAEYIYVNGQYFECWSIACAFGYMANAIGCEKVWICAHECSGGHGWVEIGGKIYDPSLARSDLSSYRYFATLNRDPQEAPRVYVKKLSLL